MKIEAFNFKRRNKIEGVEVVHEITFETHDIASCDDFFNPDLPDKLQVEIKKKSKKRSLNANAYFWKLADQLAEKLKTTSVEIYKEIIHRVGVYDDLLIRKKAEKDFIKAWESNGVGWIVEKVPYGSKEYSQLKAYKGSSQYDTKQMTRLIDELVTECEEQGINTLTPDEQAELLQRWNVKK